MTADRGPAPVGEAAPARPGSPLPPAGAPAGAELTQTLEEILAQIRRLVEVDACAFLVVDAERRLIEPAAAWFTNDETAAAIGPVLGRPYERERPGITEAAIEQGRPLLIAEVEAFAAADAVRERLLRDLPAEAADRTWRWYRRASLISCPVRATDGRMLGVLAISSTPPLPPLDEESLRMVEIFADLAAIAIDRAQLLVREAARGREEALLARAAAAVSASLDEREVHRRIVEQAAALAGAPKVALSRMAPNLQELEFVEHAGLSAQTLATRIPIGAGMIGAAAETRRPYLSRPDDAERFVSWIFEREGLRSFIHVPLEIGPRVLGVLSVARVEEPPFGEHDLELMEKFARSAAAAIANALDHGRERRVARALTRGFVPVEPTPLPGFELGLRYEPAERQAAGGDVYGVWPLPGGELAMTIGDIAGKGLEVAALAAMVRFFLEARSWDGSPPAEVFDEVGRALAARLPADSFATVFLGIVGERDLRWCNAGHAPPLVVRAGGAVERLDASGPPLGLDEREARRVDALAPLGPDDLLFAYTDGLFEARRAGELFGERRLAEAVGAAAATGGGPQDVVDDVLEQARAWAERMDDDVALLALRRAVS